MKEKPTKYYQTQRQQLLLRRSLGCKLLKAGRMLYACLVLLFSLGNCCQWEDIGLKDPWSGQQDGFWCFPSWLASSCLNSITMTLFHGVVLRAQTAQGQTSIPHHHSKKLLESLTSGYPHKWCDFSKLLGGWPKLCIDFHNIHESLQMKVTRPNSDTHLGPASISPCSVNHLRRREMRPQSSAFKETQHKAVLIAWIPANETLGIKRDYLCGNGGGGGQGNEKGNV